MVVSRRRWCGSKKEKESKNELYIILRKLKQFNASSIEKVFIPKDFSTAKDY